MFSNSKMIGGLMLKEFITSALIIDDNHKEVDELKRLLEENDIWTKHYTPLDLDNISNPINNRKIIFLDLSLDDGVDITSNIAKIRKYFSNLLGTNFGSYGIVLWTKHSDEFCLFKEKIYKTGNKYAPPLFVISMDKTKYLRENSFDNLLEDLEQELMQDVSSSFFIEWNKSVKSGADQTIKSLYSLFETPDEKDMYFESILYSLATNYVGIPQNIKDDYNEFLQKDLIKSLMDTLQFEISNSYNQVDNLFKRRERIIFNEDENSNKIKIKSFSKLNSILLLDSQNITQEYPLPGNIYIKKKSTRKDIKHFKSIFNDTEIDQIVVFDITPPCDFSNQKKGGYARIVQGVILDYNKKILKKCEGQRFYKIDPISISDKPKMIILDFYRFNTISESTLSRRKQYEIIMRAKNSLFADILQKLSSHTARIGISILDPKR